MWPYRWYRSLYWCNGQTWVRIRSIFHAKLSLCIKSGFFVSIIYAHTVWLIQYESYNVMNPIESNKKADASEYGGLDRVPHAYSMLKFLPDTELTDGSFVNLVILRNPWGRYEWTGPFSDNDEFHWSRVKDPRIQNLRIQKDEGTFFMLFADWRRQFEALRWISNHVKSSLMKVV